MLSIDISHAASFLSLPYEAALRPRLERAAGWLQNGGGKGSDFIGWVTLPRDYDRGESVVVPDFEMTLTEKSSSPMSSVTSRSASEERPLPIK